MARRARMRTRRTLVARLLLVSLAAAALLVAAAPAGAAEESAGTRAASFLSGGVGPAVLSMGGASLAAGRDVQGAAWNTAALGWLEASQFTLAHATYADQTSQEWAALGGRFGASPWRWGVAALYRDEGTIDGRSAQNAPTASASAYDLALSLQMARAFGEHLSIGGAAHGVRQAIADASGTGLAFDAGMQARYGSLSLALAGQDFGGGMLWDGQRWRMPATLGGGVALELAPLGVRVALDYRRPADQTANVRAGAEWRVQDRFAIRGGYRAELNAGSDDQRSGPTFGIGAGAGAFWVDYGYLLSGDGTGTHRVGLSLRRLMAPRMSGPQPVRKSGKAAKLAAPAPEASSK
jgi:hypothetical protein